MANAQTLYRAWDGGELLYVGLTINPGSRLLAHSQIATWWNRATHITLERLPTEDRSAALRLEAQAIRAERPLFNILCNSPVPRRPEPRICNRQTSPSPLLEAIRTNRQEHVDLLAELPTLVYEAMEAGHHWRELGDELDVGKARIYQLRAEGAAKAQ